MKFLLLLSLFFSPFLTAYPFPITEVDSDYKDVELNDLWNSMSDINDPSLEDYLSVQNYLKYGKRPYLDAIFTLPCILRFLKEYNITEVDRSHAFCNRILQEIKLVGTNAEMPVFERLVIGNSSPSDLSKCIVFYVSYNQSPHPFDKDAFYVNKMCEVIKRS